MNTIQDYDDPFRSPSPEARSNKRPKAGAEAEADDGLGINAEVDLKKRPRVPRVKLDEGRLLSEKGIPTLRRRARDLRLKGKGHEFSDAARLLSFYQLWLDDLFPKAKFLDALAMVEKAGHKTSMHKMRMDWINEGKPKASMEEDEDARYRETPAARESSRIAPIFETAARARTSVPPNDDLFEDDLYGATPRKTAEKPTSGDVPEEDDLDALMAEMDDEKDAEPATRPAPTNPFASIFGDGLRKKAAQVADEHDDDLDALMAEAETENSSVPPKYAGQSIFGDGRRNLAAEGTRDGGANKGGDDGDELDALIAEAESATAKDEAHKELGNTSTGQGGGADADEEEAMAEMDGLW